MKMLVTGAGGLVGKLVVELAQPSHDVCGLTHDDLDVTDRDAVSSAIGEFAPDVVLHCAAHTDVDGAERDPERAYEVNADATQWVAEAALRQRADLIYISTDYVFEGNATTPYREDDLTAPLSIYGKSKLAGEQRVGDVFTGQIERSVIVRTGWLYGKGKGFVDWARAGLEASKELPVVEDQTGSPTYARDLAEALVGLAESALRGVFHIVNPGEATWLGVATAIAGELGCESATLKPIRAAELGRPAPRPRYSALSVERYETATGKPVRPWRDALRGYLGMADG